jgi:hypothetical protein
MPTSRALVQVGHSDSGPSGAATRTQEWSAVHTPRPSTARS